MRSEEVAQENNITNHKYLSFYIKNEQYGLEISHINEIIAMMKVTQVPRTPDFVEGVINLRGSIIPIVDIRKKLGFDDITYDAETTIIISEISGVNIGFIVDRVEDVLVFKDEDLNEPPTFGSHIDTSFIQNVVEVGSGVMLILDMQKIFEDGELEQVSSLQEDNQESA